jgi:serine/threonine-protein kinase SRPK3
MSSEESTLEEIYRGLVLQGKYILIEKIGKGTFATVWASYNIITNSYFAVKIQNVDDYKCAQDELRYYDIINKAQNIHKPHLNISSLYEHFEHEVNEGIHYCFVFHLAAGSIYDVIRYFKYGTAINPFELNAIKTIIYQTILAIKACNENYKIIHTDIRPENILVCGLNKRMDMFNKLFKIEDINKAITERRKKYIKKYKKKNVGSEWESTTLEEVAVGYLDKIFENPFFDSAKNYYDSDDESGSESDSEIDNDNENENKTNVCNNTQIAHDKYYDLSQDGTDTEYSEEFIHSYDDDDENDNLLPIDQNYLKPDAIKIKLTDFGSACTYDRKYNNIQTRHYRAPEVVLGNTFDASCDIWSVGCVVYEIITGEILFKPNKTSTTCRDTYHLYMMYKLLGPIDSKILDKTKGKKLFFTNDNVLKIDKVIKPSSLSAKMLSDMQNNAKYSNMTEEEIIGAADFITLTLNYNPSLRPTPDQLLQHKWFDSIRQNVNEN